MEVPRPGPNSSCAIGPCGSGPPQRSPLLFAWAASGMAVVIAVAISMDIRIFLLIFMVFSIDCLSGLWSGFLCISGPEKSSHW